MQFNSKPQWSDEEIEFLKFAYPNKEFTFLCSGDLSGGAVTPDIIAAKIFCGTSGSGVHPEHQRHFAAAVEFAFRSIDAVQRILSEDEELHLCRSEGKFHRFQLQSPDGAAVVSGDITAEQSDVVEKCPVAFYPVFAAEGDDIESVEFGAEIIIGAVAAQFFRQGDGFGKSSGGDPSDPVPGISGTGNLQRSFSGCQGGNAFTAVAYFDHISNFHVKSNPFLK